MRPCSRGGFLLLLLRRGIKRIPCKLATCCLKEEVGKGFRSFVQKTKRSCVCVCTSRFISQCVPLRLPRPHHRPHGSCQAGSIRQPCRRYLDFRQTSLLRKLSQGSSFASPASLKVTHPFAAGAAAPFSSLSFAAPFSFHLVACSYHPM